MEAENGRLRRAVADLTLDNQILKEAARGNFGARPAGGDAWKWWGTGMASLSGALAGRLSNPGQHRGTLQQWPMMRRP